MRYDAPNHRRPRGLDVAADMLATDRVTDDGLEPRNGHAHSDDAISGTVRRLRLRVQ